MKKNKKLNLIFGLVYYILGFIGFFMLYVLTTLFGIISSFSSILYNICFIFLPLIILLLPIIIKIVFKKELYKSILLSCIAVAIYFVLLLVVRFAIIGYISDFTVSKWNNKNYYNLRYLMIENLEKEYDFIGMPKEDVIKILGKESYANDENFCYYIRSEWLDTFYYCLYQDKNDNITRTKIFIDD